jgi:hypothetical protein
MKFRLVEKTVAFASAYSTGSESVDVGGHGGDSYSVVCIADVDTPAAKTFDSGVAASLIVQDLTYTADLRGTAGNSITIAYTAGGTAGAEVVTVVGSAISVSIDVTPITGSSATQVAAAIDASVAASALISVAVTGTGATVQAAAAATPLAGGVASEVDVTANSVGIPSAGFFTGLKGQLTTTGTLPAGVTTGTDYFIIVVDANNIKFASSLVLAQAGTAIDLTDQGSSGAVNTFTPTSIAGGTIKLQQSNDNSNWVDLGSATNITVDANIGLEKDRPTMRYVRPYITLTAGHISASLQILVKGDKD